MVASFISGDVKSSATDACLLGPVHPRRYQGPRYLHTTPLSGTLYYIELIWLVVGILQCRALHRKLSINLAVITVLSCGRMDAPSEKGDLAINYMFLAFL